MRSSKQAEKDFLDVVNVSHDISAVSGMQLGVQCAFDSFVDTIDEMFSDLLKIARTIEGFDFEKLETFYNVRVDATRELLNIKTRMTDACSNRVGSILAEMFEDCQKSKNDPAAYFANANAYIEESERYINKQREYKTAYFGGNDNDNIRNNDIPF